MSTLAGFLSGMVGGMGFGGGGVLLLYLALFTQTQQLQAQGINLIFFLPAALVSLLVHKKNQLICWKAALPAALVGLVGMLAGIWLANGMGNTWLRRIFAFFLIIISIKEFLPARQHKPFE